jgi:hypothetical protein
LELKGNQNLEIMKSDQDQEIWYSKINTVEAILRDKISLDLEEINYSIKELGTSF